MNKIYVTTDFHQSSKNAMNYAVEMARKNNAELTLIHAYRFLPIDSDIHNSMRAERLEEVKEKTENIMLEWCKSAAEKGAFDYKIWAREGFAINVIQEKIKATKPDILIMGARNASMLDKLVFGSTTAKIMQEVDVPLLVIPEKYVYRNFEKIIYASDLHDTDIQNINKVIDFVGSDEGEITVVHVTNFNEYDSKYDIKYFEDQQSEIVKEIEYPHIKFDLIHAPNLVKVLNKYTTLADANLLVMEHKKRNWFERLFNPSATKKEFYTIQVPTLFFKIDGGPHISEI